MRISVGEVWVDFFNDFFFSKNGKVIALMMLFQYSEGKRIEFQDGNSIS
jgi:hypothetical protein